MEKTLKTKKIKSRDSLVMLSVKPPDVAPVVGIQELSIRVDKGVSPFFKEMVDDVWAIPH